MKKIYLFVLTGMLISSFSWGQSAGDFRSISAGPGNWNDFNAWERFDGTSWIPATSGQIPLSTSAVEIKAGDTMIINSTGLVSGNLTINGKLVYDVTTASALTVSGDVVVNTTGIFASPGSGTITTHALSLSGSLKVDGSFDMNAVATASVAVTFTGTANDSIYGAGTTIRFSAITVNKGTSITPILEVSSTTVITMSPPTAAANYLYVQNGTFKLSSPSVLTPYYGYTPSTPICNTTAKLWLNNAGASISHVGAGTSNPGAGHSLSTGILQIDAGTMNLGSGSTYLLMNGTLNMTGPSATLNIYGAIAFGSSSILNMTNGNINVDPQAGSSLFVVSRVVEFQSNLANGVNFTGGTLTMVDPSAGYFAGYAHFYVSGGGQASWNFAGSTIRFGDGISTTPGSTGGFDVYTGNAVLGNVVVNNVGGSNRFVRLFGTMKIGGNLIINSGASNVFYLDGFYSSGLQSGFQLWVGGNIINNGTLNANFSGSTLIMNGTGQQIISGAGTFSLVRLFTLNNTSVNNPGVDMQVPLNITDNLTLTSGSMGTSNSSLLTLGNSATVATMNIIRSGGSLLLTPTFAPAGVTFNVTYNAPVPAAAITSGNEIPSVLNGTLKINNYNATPAISGVTLNKAVSCAILDLTAGILTTSSVNMITLTGTTTGSLLNGGATSYVNGPLTRTLPSGLSGTANNYKFPVGSSTYNLFEFENITTGGTGNATFTAQSYDTGPYPGTAGYGLASINTDKFWKLSGNLGTVTIASSKIRLTDTGLGTTSKMGQSAGATGTYSSVGGITTATTISSTKTIDFTTLLSGTYFRIGVIGPGITAGLYAIGPNGPYPGYIATYTSFQSAANDVADVLVAGNTTFEFQPDYNPSVEVFPILFPQTVIGSATGLITFRPAPGVAGIINISAAGPVLNMTGCDYVVIDGRNGGTGTNNFLQFTNTSASGSVVALTNDATYNQFLYCILKSSNTTTTTGALSLTAGVSLGNSYNLVDHCNFDGSGVATYGIYAIGAAAGINTAVTVSNNNFYDFRAATNAGLYATSYNTAWTINGNSFYQTAAYNAAAGTAYGIYLATNGDNCLVYGNFIGGNAPLCAGTWTVSPAVLAVANFTGIYLSTGATLASKIYGNNIKAFDWKTNSGGTWTGIKLLSGNMNIGTDGFNTIGGTTGNDSIKVTCYTAGPVNVYGIQTQSTAGFVENNKIGALTTAANGAINVSSVVYGVYFQGTQTIRNNIIGSTTTAQSFNATTTGTTNNVIGIFSQPSGVCNITGNTIANLYNASGGMTRGISNGNYGSMLTITGNTIYTLTSAVASSGTGTASNVVGIDDEASGTSSANLIAQNIIYDLRNTGASGATTVIGILFHASDGGPNNVIEKNLVHSFFTNSPSAVQLGLAMDYGTAQYRNNVVRLGIDIAGNPVTSTAQIVGMSIGIGVGCCVPPKAVSFYFNTVYIGGSNVAAGTVKTYAFQLLNHGNYFGSGNGEDIRNNIFVNVRTNAVPNKLHYAVSLPVLGTTPWNSDYNIYQYSPSDGKLGVVGTVDMSNICEFQEALPGYELHSGCGDPLLAIPGGPLATMSLIPVNNTPAEGNGIAITGIDIDYAGLTRSANTPTDRGAYAGNFTPAGPPNDIFWPVISFANLMNTSITTGRQTYNFASITDMISGVNTTAGTKPRIYFKKKNEANAFAGNTSADNGWKWAESSSTATPFDFYLDYALLTSPVGMGDTIQYFVVAQDLAPVPNVSFKPAFGASGTSVAPAGMTAPLNPYFYKIVPLLPTTITVGAGQTYTTLTGTLASGGLFAAVNNSVINGNTTVTIVSNITEPGAVGLNLVNEEGPGGGTYTFTITPDTASRTLSGMLATAGLPLIPINGANRLIFDGGPLFHLTIRHNNATAANTGPVIQFTNSSRTDTVKNTIIESNAATQAAGAITLGSTGSNFVIISNCDIRDSRVAPVGSPTTGIYSNSVNNTLSVINNRIYNYKNTATYITGCGLYLPAVGSGCTITGNSFYMENGMNPVCPQTAIYIFNGSGHMISGNFIGGQAPSCGGSPYTFTANNVLTGIYIQSVSPGSTVQGNTIQNISITGTSGYFYGIENYAGVVNVTGNIIGSPTVANSIQIAGTGTSMGIYNYLTATGPSIFDQNTIANITFTAASGGPSFYGLRMQGGIVRRNKVFSIGAANAAATPIIMGIYNSAGSAANEFSNNMISLNGGNATNPVLYGIYETSASAGTTGCYYNSVNIYGTATGASTTYAFYRTGATVYTVSDNIFVNTRTGGTGKHYAIVSTPVTGFTSDYNDFYVTGAVLGSWGGVDKTNLAAWQAIVVAPSLDAHSLSVNPAFTSATDLHIVTDPNIANMGITVPVTIDIDGLARSSMPDMGINQFGLMLRTISLTAYLEGLYAGAGTMNTAMDFNGITFAPKWGATVADQITLELHNSLAYATVVATFANVPLNTNGTISVNIPAIYNGSYYITIKHRNSLETVSAAPVSFAGSNVTYNFSTLASQAYGSNLKNIGGVYCIYSGDVTTMGFPYPGATSQDGVIDLQDLYYIYPSYLASGLGYLPGDLNGDAVVDLFDTYMAYGNYLLGIYAMTPP